jgi:hypothetical protein
MYCFFALSAGVACIRTTPVAIIIQLFPALVKTLYLQTSFSEIKIGLTAPFSFHFLVLFFDSLKLIFA